MKVVLFQRNVVGGYSIENVAENLAHNLPQDVNAHLFKPTYLTKGILNRIKYCFQAMLRQGDVNHIIGDVYFLMCSLDNKKTILTIYDCAELMSAEKGFIRKRIYKLIWFTLPKYFCRYIVTISKESKNNLIRYAGFARERIMVIPVGIDSRFQKINLTKEEKEALLDNKEGKKTVLHISSHEVNKNVLRLIESIKTLNVKLIKVGVFSNEESLALKKYHIDYLQFKNIDLERVVKIYNAVDCLAFPSLVEGFGMPVIEAQKCGCPVITSNTSSLPEVAGDGAILVDPYSIGSITEGIKKVLFDEELKNGIVRRGFINADRFKWSKIALEYYALYRRVLEANS